MLDKIKAETISMLESPFLISEYVKDKFLIVFKILSVTNFDDVILCIRSKRPDIYSCERGILICPQKKAHHGLVVDGFG